MQIKPVSMAEQMRMIRPVEGITPRNSTEGMRDGISAPGEKSNKVSFSEFLSQQFEQANQLGVDADKAITRSILGQEQNPHNTIIAVQKADIALTLLLSVKERLERAYQEIIRTSM